MRTMNIRSHLRQNQMNQSTSDIISPNFIERSERFEFEFQDARRDVEVLLVLSCAALLNSGAEHDGDEFLIEEGAEVYACAGFDPGFEVGDPGVVAFDLAVGVELPESDLQAQVVSRPDTGKSILEVFPAYLCECRDWMTRIDLAGVLVVLCSAEVSV